MNSVNIIFVMIVLIVQNKFCSHIVKKNLVKIKQHYKGFPLLHNYMGGKFLQLKPTFPIHYNVLTSTYIWIGKFDLINHHFLKKIHNNTLLTAFNSKQICSLIFRKNNGRLSQRETKKALIL